MSFGGDFCRWLAVIALAVGDALGAAAPIRREAVQSLRPEDPAQRGWRLAEVTRRRLGPAVIVHRGATAFAPENTLHACAYAMDYGADGVETDLRRAADGTLVLFHDETVERLLMGFGRVRDYDLPGLLALEPVRWRGRPQGGAVATFADLLHLVRERAMLLHLDLKEPGLEAEVAGQLADADVWAHVVSINEAHAATLRQDPRFEPLRYKAPGLQADRLDVDPAAVRAALAADGDMILVDDPRVATHVLARPAHAPERFTIEYRLVLPLPDVQAGAATTGVPAMVRRLQGAYGPLRGDAFLPLLAGGMGDPNQVESAPPTAAMIRRAWAAMECGRQTVDTRAIRRALERIVARPTFAEDPDLHALDALIAARALGQLGATGSADNLIEAWLRYDGRSGPDTPPADLWRRWRERMTILPALGEMPCRTARRFLWRYVVLPPEVAARFGPLEYADATRSLLAQVLMWDEIAELVRSPIPAVRGTAILECLDHPTEDRRRALQAGAPWALQLPSARP